MYGVLQFINQLNLCIMNDIEKMKAEYEQKIKWAEIENELSKKLPEGTQISIIGKSLTQKGKLQTSIRGENWSRGLTEQQVGELMLAFPVTEKSRTYVGKDQYSEKEYEMQTHRYLNCPNTDLNISWISGELAISLELKVELCSDEIKQFFTRTSRNVNHEWHGTRARWNKHLRDNFPFYTFAYGHTVKFEGGYHKQVSDSALSDMVEKFKYLAEYVS